MENLEQKYAIELDSIKGTIQSSDLLQTYLDDEEDASYQALRESFEPQIDQIYQKVAAVKPLQLISLENKLLDPEFEGLYLSRILGYAVLRGEVDELFRYKRPQDHFKDILLAICGSSNFDLISLRIGQGVQVGFGLSSNIWITNLIEQVEFKKVKQFLRGQILTQYREPEERKKAYDKYARQFASMNYYSAEFPKTTAELKILFSSLLNFLRIRVKLGEDNSNLLPHILEFLNNKEFFGTEEYVKLLHIFINFYSYDEHKAEIAKHLNRERKDNPGFNKDYFEFHEEVLESELSVGMECDEKVRELIDDKIEDDMKRFYELMHTIHTKGYVHDDTIETVRAFYDGHEGLSTINDCLRKSILNHFRRLLSNLSVDEYSEYFEVNKVFAVYIQLFNNQQFNIDLKKYSLSYIAKLLKKYTDKRGKDYQEIKKFVISTFLDFGFLTEKELVELFKTRRKKKKPA